MSDLEKAHKLEELRYERLFAELSRGEQEAAQRIDRVMGETGNYHSSARFSEIIRLKAATQERLIDGRLNIRRELAKSIPELVGGSELNDLMQQIHGDLSRFWGGLVQAPSRLFPDALRPQIDQETIRLREHAKREVEIMKREHALNLHERADTAALSVNTGGGPAIVNFGEMGGGVQQVVAHGTGAAGSRPRAAIVFRDGSFVMENYGPRLFQVNLRSPPIGEICVKWQEILAVPEGASIPVTFTLLSTDVKTVFDCGLESAVLGSAFSAVQIRIVCRDQDRSSWEGSGALFFDPATRQWRSVGFEEMQPIPIPLC